MNTSRKSAYLNSQSRLADVIAAIQAMATYKFYKLDFAGWADRITGDPGAADYWEAVFRQHPEFFRLDSGSVRASLVWRRQHQKRFSVDEMRILSREEFYALDDAAKGRVSRTPLTSDEIGTLIKTAVDLHARALARLQDARWWIPLLAGLLGMVIGSLLQWGLGGLGG
jgi:hypothetical protein